MLPLKPHLTGCLCWRCLKERELRGRKAHRRGPMSKKQQGFLAKTATNGREG